MPCVRVLERWEIRPTSALRGFGRSRALMWQRMRGLLQACRRGEGYRVPGTYDDHDNEEQEMVSLEVMTCHDFIITGIKSWHRSLRSDIIDNRHCEIVNGSTGLLL